MPFKCMKKCMKIRTKWGIKWSYRPWGRKTLQKLRKKMTKHLSAALPSRREREKVEKLLKKMFETVNELFLKNLKHDVRLIKKQVRLIEPGSGSLKFLNKISIDRKLDWINRNSGKTVFERKNLIFWNLTSKHWI